MTEYRLKEGHYLSGRYRIIRSIGQGGFGITYLAEDELLGQQIVIKEYFPAALAGRSADGAIELAAGEEHAAFAEGKSRFLREARILTSLLDVSGVVKAWNYFQENNTAYLVMEYVQGVSLRSWLEQNGEVTSFAQALQMLRPVVLALAKIHEKGLLHRDITPDNLMVGAAGNLKLLDFGSARVYLREQDSGATKTVLLKSGYAPPEQYDGNGAQGPWVDLYALCATLYEMITGSMPEDAIRRQIRDELEAPSAYGVEITQEQEEALLKRGLALDYHERYASVAELLADFYPEEQPTVRSRRNGRRRALFGGGVLAACLLLAAGLHLIGTAGGRQADRRAGNLDRGSREYEAFLSYVREHAETELSGDTKAIAASGEAELSGDTKAIAASGETELSGNTKAIAASGEAELSDDTKAIAVSGETEFSGESEAVQTGEKAMHTSEKEVNEETQNTADIAADTSGQQVYFLNEEAVREIALPGNQYYDMPYTPEELLAHLQVAGFSVNAEPERSTEYFTVTTEAYGIIRTDFTVEDGYQLPNDIRLLLDYDYNNNLLHALRLIPQQQDEWEQTAEGTIQLLNDLLPELPQEQRLSEKELLEAMEQAARQKASGSRSYFAWAQGDLQVELCAFPEEDIDDAFRNKAAEETATAKANAEAAEETDPANDNAEATEETEKDADPCIGIRICRRLENAPAYNW